MATTYQNGGPSPLRGSTHPTVAVCPTTAGTSLLQWFGGLDAEHELRASCVTAREQFHLIELLQNIPQTAELLGERLSVTRTGARQPFRKRGGMRSEIAASGGGVEACQRNVAARFRFARGCTERLDGIGGSGDEQITALQRKARTEPCWECLARERLDDHIAVFFFT